MQKPYIVIIGVSIFFITLFLVNTIHQYDQVLQEQTQIAAIDLLATQVPPPWELEIHDQEELQIMNEDEKLKAQELKFDNGITREQLGNAGWTLLHMISSTLPVNFEEDFTFKINVFLNLFGQFFPCKECAGHFLNMTTHIPFEGNSRVDFMIYLCTLHNIVNERLNKTQFNCSEVHNKWGGNCGCVSAFEESLKKYGNNNNGNN